MKLRPCVPNQMGELVECVIFDLSEVLIAGLVGVENVLASELGVSKEAVLPALSADPFIDLLIGEVSEDAYLEHVVVREKWTINIDRLKRVIRDNFHNEVEGSLSIIADLSPKYDLVLLSDHAREWIEYIRTVHPFLGMFMRGFFSFELRMTKDQPQTFKHILGALEREPEECVFIDDNPGNVVTAESVGIRSIRFRSAEQLRTDLLAIRV